MTEKFLFVISLPPDASNRSKELLSSVTRSHAAKVAHKRVSEKRHGSSTTFGLDGKASKPKSISNADKRISSLQIVRSKPSVLRGSFILTEEQKAILDEITKEQLATWTRLDHSARQRLLTDSSNKVDLPLTLDLDQVNTLCGFGDVCNWSLADLILVWHITNAASEPFCKIWKVQNVYTQEWLHLLVDEAFFHVGAALVKYEYNALVNPGNEAPPEVIHHKIEAMKVVRRRLEESNGVLDIVTLIAIMFLPFVEVRINLSIQPTACPNTNMV